MNTISTPIRVLIFASLLASSLACTCLPRTFLESYLAADSVVRAKVLSVTRYAPGCSGSDCLIPPGPFNGDLLIKFRRQRMYKDCGPSEKIFYGKTNAQSAACGVMFTVGKSYMLNLPEPTFVRRMGSPTKFYMLNICQFHARFSTLSRNRKSLLSLLSMEPEYKCVIDDITSG